MSDTWRNRLRATVRALGAQFNSRRVTEDLYDVYGVAEHLHRESVRESAAFIKARLNRAVLLLHREQMFDYAVARLASSFRPGEGLCLEFGVASGASINYFGRRLPNRFFGFDTFEGLPKDWHGWNLAAGAFDLKGRLPAVPPNVTLVKGRIEQTLPRLLGEITEPVAFIHIDTDLYEPAKVVLKECKGRVMQGALILFDEFHSYAGWTQHEYRALTEVFSESEYEFVGFSNYKQALVRIAT